MHPFSYYFIPAFWVLLVVIIAFFLGSTIKRMIEKLIEKFTFIPNKFSDKLLETFIRVILLNWYTIIMMTLLLFLLYGTDIGRDIMTGYIENLMTFNHLERIGSFISLFFSIFLMSIAIWVIPFFLYSEERRIEILSRVESYYVATKILAFFAMGPFLIVANAFIYYVFAANETDPKKEHFNLMLMFGINLGVFIIFPLIISQLQKISQMKWIQLVSEFIGRKFENGYWQIITKIILWVLIIAVLGALPNLAAWATSTIAILVGIFIMITSMIVFLNLYYTNEKGKDVVSEVKKRVESMIHPNTSHYSKSFYLKLFWVMLGGNILFYLLPSLAATPTLYVLLLVFAFYIIFLDYCRNLFKNGKGFKKVFAFLGTTLLLLTPFLNHPNQFRVKYLDISIDKAQFDSLNNAISYRINTIHQKTLDSNLFIICAMGGGSRAGYIAAGVLAKLDSISADINVAGHRIFDRTLAFSTISGGSVGTYHYINGTITGEMKKDSEFLSYMFEKNYNTSGAFGLLFGDAFESIFRFLASWSRSIFTGSRPPNGFHDRNYRIRKEYDYYLEEAMQKGTPTANGYFDKTFYPWLKKEEPLKPDSFRSFYLKHGASLPIHFVNTFEVSNGRRTILSPFPIYNNKFFPNAVLPLDEKRFDTRAPFVDIYYREAVNMSELFPLVSAASHLGDTNMSQFVDGGYYENYGLASGLDLVQYLIDSIHYPKDKIKMILIKNSEQNAKDTVTRNVQLLAPLIGAMNAPFTGHANHFIDEAYRRLGGSQFKVITFNADKYNVPLTRAINNKHIDSMNQYLSTLKYDTDLLNFIRKKAK